jgi:exosortase A
MIGSVRRLEPPERSFVWVAAVLMAVAAAFWSVSASMVSVWSGSGTYSHGFFIVPAFLWLAWGRRRSLAVLPAQPSWVALPIVAAVGLIALVGDWMALSLLGHIALVAMVPAVIAGLFGVAWVRALAFPLAFLFFAVPFGDSWVPTLMNWTADFTVAALKLTGVPVYRDGLHFDIPSGRWSVVDSCSGIRYLFACLAVSSLYSWTVYRGTGRRLLFIGIAVVIAIVANWIRAYAIVMLGHLSNNQIATGADHLVYGGIFFAFIMAIVFAVGSAWREDTASGGDGQDKEPAEAPASTPALRLPQRNTTRMHGAIALATIASSMVWAALLSASDEPTHPATVAALEVRPAGDWAPIDTPVSAWRPVLNNPASVHAQSFAKGSRTVAVHLGLFGRPTPESKLTSSMNRLLKPDGLDPHWKLAWQGAAQMQWAGQATDVRAGTLVGDGTRLRVWQWYWVDGTATADPIRAAALQMLARWRGRGEVSAWMTVYTLEPDHAGTADGTLQDFMAGLSVAAVPGSI